MDDKQFGLLETLLVRPLKGEGAEVFIFGSRISDQHHPHSDVDILYRLPSGKKLQPGFVSSLREAIEESHFPFTVDLVLDADLASSYRQQVFSTMRKL
jgi:predicted nucleotidyltransferase